MQTKTKVVETYQAIQDYAQSPLGDMRVIDECPVGYHVRQGDLYVQRIKSFNKEDYKEVSNRQLAPGQSKGSRHTVSDSVTVYEPIDKSMGNAEIVNGGIIIKGPIIESKDRFSVMHVEHADMSMPCGTYQIMYQADPQTMRRVQD